MWINKISIFIIFFSLLYSCNKNSELKNNVKIQNIFSYSVENIDKDSNLKICLQITNNSGENICFPISYWFYNLHNNNGGIFYVSDSSYIGLRNFITFYERIQKENFGVLDIREHPTSTKWPLFIFLRAYNKINFCISIPKYRIKQNKELYAMFKENNKYYFNLKLPYIKYSSLLALVGEDVINQELKFTKDNINLPLMVFNSPFSNIYLSNRNINEKELEFLNNDANKRLDIYFEYEPKY